MTTAQKTIFTQLCALLIITAAAGERQIITAPIVVKAGDTLTIQAGAELLFAPYTGVTVKRGGRLSASGTKERPVTFTSASDTAGTGAAFDWEGIEIESGGEAALSYCLIANASAGVTAADSGGVTLTQCIFSTNGQWDLSIAGATKLFPQDMRPRDYLPARPEAAPPELVIPPPDVTAAPEPAPKAEAPQNTRGRKVTGWLMGGAGAAAAAVGIAYIVQANGYAAEYNAYVPGKTDFDNATARERQERFDKLRKQNAAAKTAGWIFLGLAAADGIYLTFIF